MTPPLVVVIAGPTASGKSALALQVAEALNGVIINADSIQCYRNLPILTARPTPDDERRAPHKIYGMLAPTEMLSATAWATQAAQEITIAAAQNLMPIVTGGTGFYLKALMEGLADIPPVPDEIRAATQRIISEIGSHALYEKLKVRDPVTAARLQPGDKQRVARAWEVLEATDTPLSTWQSRPTMPPLAAKFITLLLQPDRDALYQACDARFLAMLQNGAVAEVDALLKTGIGEAAPVMRALGAAELATHISGKLTLTQAAEQAQATTRHYAKRQTTWFRHQFHADYAIETKYSESFFDKIFPEIRRLLLT